MGTFDFEAFDTWLRESRHVMDEHRFAYRQGAERIVEVAGDAPLRHAHVEEAIRREIDRGATPKAVANLRAIGDALLAFARQRPIATNAPPPIVPSEAATSKRRPAWVIAAPLAGLMVIGLAAFTFASMRRARPRDRAFGTLTMRTGLNCRIDAIGFEYSYAWKPAEHWIGKHNDVSAKSDTLHFLHNSGSVALKASDLREVRFFATDAAHPHAVTGLEIIDRSGQHYDFVPSGGQLFAGDGTKIWSDGKVAWWRTPEVTMHLTAPGCPMPAVELSRVDHSENTFAVRVEVH